MPTYQVPVRVTLEVAATLTIDDIDAEHATVLASRVVDGLSVSTEDVLGRGGKLEADVDVGDVWIGEPLRVASDGEGDEGSGAQQAPPPAPTPPTTTRSNHSGVIPRDQYWSD